MIEQRGGMPDAGRRISVSSGLASVLLPSVVHEASAAILIVDVRRREVTYANELARELTPDEPLPIAVDRWSAAAGLEDVTGDVLPEGPGSAASRGNPAESLLRIAQGQPVTGEAVTAARATSATNAREVLWVLGLPLDGAPAPMENLALVVFLPARNAQLIAGVQESAATLRDRAVLATRMSFTITDPTQPDDPLVWVNPAFTETTGYSFEEAVGRNCRFLQGDGTNRQVVSEIHQSLHERRPLTTTLLNFRKDGTHFWNELSVSPIRDVDGNVTHFVGVQADVTARVEAQQARDDALSQVADAADRLALLADFTSRMAMSRSPEQILELFGEVLVPRVGTWCVVLTYDSTGHLATPYVRHERGAVPEVAQALDTMRDLLPGQLQDSSPVWRVLSGAERFVLIKDYDAEPASVSGAADDERTSLTRRLGTRSVAAVPLLARAGIVGCVALIADASRPPLGDTELSLLRDLAVRGGLMLENTQLYAQERATAAILQRSLLPRLPEIDGIEIAAAYVPAADEAAVGGDWYDVFATRDGGVGLAVGDVMGHNVDSAARMGKVSTILRALAWPGISPCDALTSVDELLTGSGLDVLATALYAKLVLTADGGATVHYASAGHPPAVVRLPDGTATTLQGGNGAMLGISALTASGAERPGDSEFTLPRGSTLVAFTDGLTDGFAAEPDLDLGLRAVLALLSDLPADAGPQQIVDTLTGATRMHKDDVAIIAVRIG